MSRRGMLNTPVVEISDWAIDTSHKGAAALFAAMALEDLEGKWVRLSANTQRRVVGYAVFGKAPIFVENNEVRVHRSGILRGGFDVYSASEIDKSAKRERRLDQV